MKLIIQIPCFNEEQTLPQTLRDLPTSIPGVDVIEVLVVDDGSTDRTAQVARQCGVHHLLRLGTNRGLARAYTLGLEKALALGADIVVNTDADNQYCGADIPLLLEPILRGEAEIVVGCRPILHHPEFGSVKKALQVMGSWVLRQISKTTVRDAASGFRAHSREACQRLQVYSRFSYCMETLIQAGNSKMRVASVDIRVNAQTRPSRLFKSLPQYVVRQAGTMLVMFILYRPVRFFGLMAALCFAAALVLGVRFLYLVYLTDTSITHRTHLPSLVLLAICAMSGGLFSALAVLAELVRAQRVLMEEAVYLLRRHDQPPGRAGGPPGTAQP